MGVPLQFHRTFPFTRTIQRANGVPPGLWKLPYFPKTTPWGLRLPLSRLHIAMNQVVFLQEVQGLRAAVEPGGFRGGDHWEIWDMCGICGEIYGEIHGEYRGKIMGKISLINDGWSWALMALWMSLGGILWMIWMMIMIATMIYENCGWWHKVLISTEGWKIYEQELKKPISSDLVYFQNKNKVAGKNPTTWANQIIKKTWRIILTISRNDAEYLDTKCQHRTCQVAWVPTKLMQQRGTEAQVVERLVEDWIIYLMNCQLFKRNVYHDIMMIGSTLQAWLACTPAFVAWKELRFFNGGFSHMAMGQNTGVLWRTPTW